MLSQVAAGVQACGGLWRRVECCAAHDAIVGTLGQLWPLWCCACVCDGRCVILRIALRARTCEWAGVVPLAGLCGAFVQCLVLGAIVIGAQHFSLHGDAFAAADVLRVHAAAAVRAQEGSRCVAWWPCERARAGRGEKASTSHGEGGKLFAWSQHD